MIQTLEQMITCDACDGPVELVILDNRHKGKGARISVVCQLQRGSSKRVQHFCTACMIGIVETAWPELRARAALATEQPMTQEKQ